MSRWDKEENLSVAADRTKKAQNDLSALENILRKSLRIDVSLDWDSLKNLSNYRVGTPSRPKQEPEPLESDNKYNVKLEFLDKLIRSRKESKKAAAKNQFMKDHKKWMEDSQKASEDYKASLETWKSKKDKFLSNLDKHNSKIDDKKQAYLQGTLDSVLDYYNIILSKSKYPDYFPKSFELDYNPDNKLLIIDRLSENVRYQHLIL